MSALSANLDQQRAKAAALAANKIDIKEREKYADAAKKSVARLRTAGLMATLVYGENKKGEDAKIAEALSEFLKLGKKPDDAAVALTQSSSHALRLKTIEAEAFLIWVARFADAGTPS